jgi:hypothetical protein
MDLNNTAISTTPIVTALATSLQGEPKQTVYPTGGSNANSTSTISASLVATAALPPGEPKVPAYPTTPAPPSNSTVPAVKSFGDGFSTGALAGGMVGAAVAGAILAFLLTFFIMSSRRKKYHRHHSSIKSKKHEGSALPGPEMASAPFEVERR